ncbi:hypothetical protein SSPO_083340 [Streptomyces antimycoticus]|uniref:Uncharacterized protein n=1 Tax=Streptomyces antimycoticus TaxID=68175 RepID=A0A499VBP7_9ACTN|nr:hypothetical protein SSPO_083340 [Streptomyces antimycoticus]
MTYAEEGRPKEGWPGRRAVVVTTTLAGIGTAIGTGDGTAHARDTAPGRAAAHARTTERTLRSKRLEVRVDPEFPRIVAYIDRETGAVLHGQREPVRSVLIDGVERTPRTTAVTSGPDHISYTLAFGATTATSGADTSGADTSGADTSGTATANASTSGADAEIDIRIRVSEWQVDWRVTRIADTDALRVGTLRIPQLAFLSVRADQPGATLLAARIDLDQAKSGDTTVRPTADTPTDGAPIGCAYAVVSTDRLAAAVETNTVWDKPSSAAGTTWENGRLWRQTVREDGQITTRLTCGEWTHRAAAAAVGATEPLPWATVVLTRDRNGDGVVDWQDAAIAFRDIMVNPLGADEQHLRVVPHIPFNFASQATNPFLDTLDNVKRIALATDGLRQYTLLKGYQSEGHDSAHPDYAGNYNTRAGGLADLNTLLRSGRHWNSDFAVHVNATESYPVANAFSETLVDKDDKQWDWLDQSYRIDPRRDLVSGDIIRRFQDLRDDTDPALAALYIDVFRESGWNSDRLQRALCDQGWHLTTEWGHGLERSSLWSHWATETDYGPDTSRGINSRLIRFIRNHQKDVFADKWPTLLGIPRMGNFEGWTGKTDWTVFYRLIWTHSLPAKYLQAYPIRTWGTTRSPSRGPAAPRSPTPVASAASPPTGGWSTTAAAICCPGSRARPPTRPSSTTTTRLAAPPVGHCRAAGRDSGPWCCTASPTRGAPSRSRCRCAMATSASPPTPTSRTWCCAPEPVPRRPPAGARAPRCTTPVSTPDRCAAGRPRARPPSNAAHSATTNWSSARARPPPSASDSTGWPPAAMWPPYRWKWARRPVSGGGPPCGCTPPTASPRRTGPRPRPPSTTWPPTANTAPVSSGCSPPSPSPTAADRSPSPWRWPRAAPASASTGCGWCGPGARRSPAPWCTRTSSGCRRAGARSSRATRAG